LKLKGINSRISLAFGALTAAAGVRFPVWEGTFDFSSLKQAIFKWPATNATCVSVDWHHYHKNTSLNRACIFNLTKAHQNTA